MAVSSGEIWRLEVARKSGGWKPWGEKRSEADTCIGKERKRPEKKVDTYSITQRPGCSHMMKAAKGSGAVQKSVGCPQSKEVTEGKEKGSTPSLLCFHRLRHEAVGSMNVFT